jgi:hypothetical protein
MKKADARKTHHAGWRCAFLKAQSTAYPSRLHDKREKPLPFPAPLATAIPEMKKSGLQSEAAFFCSSQSSWRSIIRSMISSGGLDFPLTDFLFFLSASL